METVLNKTTKEDQRIAQSFLTQFSETYKITVKSSKFARIKFQEKGDFVKIPIKALKLLFVIVSNMAEGKSITLIPSNAEIGTQQAADMLHVSRPHFVKLLEEGKIPFTKVGAHRRIELKHLMEYQSQLKDTRKEQLDFLAKQAQELNMGY